MLQELGTIEYFPCLQVTWEVSILELPVRLNIFDRILVRAFLLQQGKLYWNASAHYFSSFCSDLGQVMEKLSEIRKHWGIPNLSKMLIKWALEFEPCSIVTFLERVIISLNRKVPVLEGLTFVKLVLLTSTKRDTFDAKGIAHVQTFLEKQCNPLSKLHLFCYFRSVLSQISYHSSSESY